MICWVLYYAIILGGGDSRHFGPMRLLLLNWCRAEYFAACVIFLSFSFLCSDGALIRHISYFSVDDGMCPRHSCRGGALCCCPSLILAFKQTYLRRNFFKSKPASNLSDTTLLLTTESYAVYILIQSKQLVFQCLLVPSCLNGRCKTKCHKKSKIQTRSQNEQDSFVCVCARACVCLSVCVLVCKMHHMHGGVDSDQPPLLGIRKLKKEIDRQWKSLSVPLAFLASNFAAMAWHWRKRPAAACPSFVAMSLLMAVAQARRMEGGVWLEIGVGHERT